MIHGFCYAQELLTVHPGLQAMVLYVRGLSVDTDVSATVDANLDSARALLADRGPESQIESIRQWRLAYRQFNTDPTKFRMAAESILRRLRTTGEFTRALHPLVVLCNSYSARFAVPVAALDVTRIDGLLRVCPASGASHYEGFDGASVVVPAGEVTFEDEASRAHARKWSHKQSAYSAMRDETTSAIIVAEALHAGAQADLQALLQALTSAIRCHWPDAALAGRILSGDTLGAHTPYPF